VGQLVQVIYLAQEPSTEYASGNSGLKPQSEAAAGCKVENANGNIQVIPPVSPAEPLVSSALLDELKAA